MSDLRKIVFLSALFFAWNSISAYDIENNGFYYNILSANSLEVTHGDNKYEGDIIVPEKTEYNGKTYDVVSVGESAFEGCDKLVTIKMGKNITSIGARAFYGCSSLKDFSFNTNKIGNYAFAYCTSITAINLNINRIPNGMFRGCTSLSSMSVKTNSFGEYSFADCTALTGNYRFGCSIEANAFSGCTGITSVTLNAMTPLYIGIDAFANCTSITTLKLVSTTDQGFIYDIGKGFGLCPNLKEINVDDYRYGKVIDGCFYSAFTLGISAADPKEHLHFLLPHGSTYFIVPDVVKSINSYAFSTAGTLRRIIFGSSQIQITKGAFLNCPNLEEIYCYGKTPEVISGGWFHNKLFGKLKVYVPTGCKSNYENVQPWKDFIIEEFDTATFDPSTTGVTAIVDKNEVQSINSLSGRRLSSLAKGINIIKMKDGTTKKVFVK